MLNFKDKHSPTSLKCMIRVRRYQEMIFVKILEFVLFFFVGHSIFLRQRVQDYDVVTTVTTNVVPGNPIDIWILLLGD